MKQINELENKMVKYSDLINISVKENAEPLVKIDKKIIPVEYLSGMDDMKPILDNEVYVRQTVQQRLYRVQERLLKLYPNLTLCVTYGYRNKKVQTRKFQEMLSIITKKHIFTNPVNLYEETHRYIAVPTVAGHPTGGAVDVVVKNSKIGRILDFGSQIYDFSTKKSYTFTEDISQEAKLNRELLRNLMLGEDFAPYDGEWWHFSFGDREWAFYYKRSGFYDQVSIEEIQK